MRKLLLTIIFIFLAMPVYAGSNVCRVNGPHNCTESNEDQLVAITHETIDHMQLIHRHQFKTQNDKVLENMARNHAYFIPANHDNIYLFQSR